MTCPTWPRQPAKAIAFIMVAFSFACPTRAAETPDDPAAATPVMFVDSRGVLWLGDLDGSNAARVPVQGTVIHAEAAPSMEQLLFVTEEQKTDANDSTVTYLSYQLYVSDFAGGGARLVSDKLGMGNPYFLQDIAQPQPVPMFVESGGPRQAHWNVDSRHILYTGRRDKDGSFPVYVADVADNTEKEIARIPATRKIEIDLSAPSSWAQIPASPVAERFVQDRPFLKLYNAPGALDLDRPNLRMRPGQPAPKPVVNAWYGSTFAWHPDGKSLTWSSSGDTNSQGIYVRELSDFHPDDPNSIIASTNRIYWGEQFLWAPNGEYCAVHLPYTTANGGTAHQVFLSSRTNIIRLLFDLPPWDRATTRPVTLRTWSPDSSRLAITVHTPTQNMTTLIIDLAAPAGAPPVQIPQVVAGQASPVELSIHKFAFTPDSQTFSFVETTTNAAGKRTGSVLATVALPPRGEAPTGAVTVVKHNLGPPGTSIEEVYFVKPKEELCPPLELVIPAGGRDAIFAQTSEDPALAQADPDKREKELAEVRKRRDTLLSAWVRLPDLKDDHKKRAEELRQLLKKPDPAAATWTPWQPTEWDKQRRFLEKHLRGVEADYVRTVAAVYSAISEAEEHQLLASLNARVECLSKRTAKALDDTRSATAPSQWGDYSLKKSGYDSRYDDLVHTLTLAQAINAMRLANAQSTVAAARARAARAGALASDAATLRAPQRRLRDVYIDIGEAALRLNAAQAEAGLLAQESYFASFWNVYKQAGNTEWADSARGKAFQGMVFGTRALVAGGMSAMGALVDTGKRIDNWMGYSPFDPAAKEITRQLGESREAAELALRTLQRVRGLSDDLTRGLLDRGTADAGVSQLSTNHVFIEQTAGGWRRLAMCYETDAAKLMEHEYLATYQHLTSTIADMEKVFNARVLADAKGEFGAFQILKGLLTDPLGKAKVYIQNQVLGGDHFSAPLDHIALRKAQAQDMMTLLPSLRQAGFDPVRMAMTNPRKFADYLTLAKANPDFLQWTLTRARLDAQRNVELLEFALAVAPPEARASLERKITFNRALVALETSDQQAWLMQLQGLDRMMVWDYDGALECFYQASECNSNAFPRANYEQLRAALNWQRTVETGMETFQQTGNLALQAALFEFVGGRIGQGLGMPAGGAAPEAVAAAEEGSILLRPMYGSKFLDFAWKQFNPFSDFLHSFYEEEASLAKVGQQSFGLAKNVGVQMVQNDLIKTSLLKGWCGLDDQWADFLANAIMSVGQIKPGDQHTLFWELCLRLKAAGNDLRWELVDLGLIGRRDQARRAVSDYYFFHEMLMEAKEAREKLNPEKLAKASDAQAKVATQPLADALAKLETQTKPLTPETLKDRFDKFFGPESPKPGTEERIARIAEFFQGMHWKDLMAVKLTKEHPLNRMVDNLRREIIAVTQVEFFNDPRFKDYRQYLVAYLYIGSAGKKTSAAYKLIDSDIDFTMLVSEETPETVRNRLREDFMTYFQERANGMSLEDYEMSVMVDPMPKFDPAAESTRGIMEILWVEANPAKRAESRAKLRANLEKTIEQLIRNASDKERYLDRGNLFRHNVFVRLGCFLKRAASRSSAEGVELEDLPPEEYDKLYGNVPLEPWMAFDAIVGNLGYIFQHAPDSSKDIAAYHKVLSGKYAIRGVLFPLLVMSPEGRGRLGQLTRSEVEANGWEGAERICIEVAREILAQPDGLKKLGLPATLEAPGHEKPLVMTAADWARLFDEWGNMKEGLPLNEVFGKPRQLNLPENHRLLNAYMAENIVKTEAAFRAVLRRSILEQGAMLKNLQAAERTAKAAGDAEAIDLLRLKMKEILVSQAAVWNRMSREQQVVVLKEMPPEADWWAAIAEVESLKDSAAVPAPTPLNPNRVVISREALLSWQPRVFMNEPIDVVARRITLMKEKAEMEKKAAVEANKRLLDSNPQAAP